MYLTGNDDSHKLLRIMVTDHMSRNIDHFLVLKNMVDRPNDFLHYLNLKRSARGRGMENWADEDILIATSSLLKTPIVCYAPLIEKGVNKNMWCTIEGVVVIREAIYPDQFNDLIHTNRLC